MKGNVVVPSQGERGILQLATLPEHDQHVKAATRLHQERNGQGKRKPQRQAQGGLTNEKVNLRSEWYLFLAARLESAILRTLWLMADP